MDAQHNRRRSTSTEIRQNDTFVQTLSRSEKRYHNEKPFVKVTALGLDLEHGSAEGESVEWGGRRAWFDESVALARRREAHELDGVEQNVNRAHAPSDSYCEWDFERWGDYQGELSSSIMAGIDDRAELPELPLLPVIVDVEASDDVLYQASLT